MHNKVHHIIPREYIENFSDPLQEKKNVWVLNTKEKKIYPATPAL
jgi:hypothetical protein